LCLEIRLCGLHQGTSLCKRWYQNGEHVPCSCISFSFNAVIHKNRMSVKILSGDMCNSFFARNRSKSLRWNLWMSCTVNLLGTNCLSCLRSLSFVDNGTSSTESIRVQRQKHRQSARYVYHWQRRPRCCCTSLHHPRRVAVLLRHCLGRKNNFSAGFCGWIRILSACVGTALFYENFHKVLQTSAITGHTSMQMFQ